MKYQSAVIVLLVFVLSACGGGGSSGDTDQVEPDSAADPTDTADPIVPADPTPPTDENVSSVVGTVGNLSFGECGTARASAAVSNDADLPTALSLGELAVGEVTQAGIDIDNAQKFWSFNVPAGDYALVVEPFNENRLDVVLFLQVFSDGQMIGEINNDLVPFTLNRTRQARQIFPITASDAGVTVEIRSSIKTQNYELSLFYPSDVIPSPFLSRCPDVTVTSVGTTEAFTLVISDDALFTIDLPAGESQVTTNRSSVDGNILDSTLVIFPINGVADESSAITLEQSTPFGDTDQTIQSFSVGQAGQYYMQWRNPIEAVNIDFTVN